MLLTSSIASMAAGSYEALDVASKSFLQSFAQAIGQELEGSGVTILPLVPGPTDTNFFGRGGMSDTETGASQHKSSPAEVAAETYQALMEGKAKVVAGNVASKAQAAAMRVLPAAAKVAMHRKQSEPGSAS